MSDITFIIGKIGSGKSLFATIQVCEELARSERFIVSSVPLDIGALAEYCNKYIQRPININQRVRVLTTEEAKQFWMYLPQRDLVTFDDVASRQGKDYGTFYQLDEAHLIYSARNWAKIGNVVEQYMSQLRKLNDDLYVITQHPEKVDKNFRRNATQWLYIKNLGKSRLLLGVGMPGRFRWNIYSEQPQRGDKPEESGWFNIKARDYGALYNTMAGVGFAGKLNPETPPKRGHWSRWAAAIVLCVAVAWVAPRAASWIISKFVGIGVQSSAQGIKSQTGIDSVMAQGATEKSNQPITTTSATGTVQEKEPVIYMTGYDGLLGIVRAWLSDGSQIVPSKVDSKGAWLHGQLYPWRPLESQAGDHATLTYAPVQPSIQYNTSPEDKPESSGSTLYVIPHHQNSQMATPAVGFRNNR